MRGWMLIAAMLVALAGCNDGEPPPAGLPHAVTISGLVQFERVPVTATGLDYAAITPQPARRIRLELRKADGSSTGRRTITDESGRYELDVIGDGRDYLLVAVAELRRGSQIEARVVSDLGVVTAAVPLVAQRDDFEFNLVIPAGWDGGSYDGSQRHAGAFAILDTIHQVQDAVLAVESGLYFPELTVLWDQAETGTSYHPTGDLLFISGVEDVDTDEFDQHVVAHEYSHYLHHHFSRDDSLGGSHQIDDLLDETVAFSEGFASALAGIVLEESIYRDTGGAGQGTLLVEFDLEAGNASTLTTVDPLDLNSDSSEISIMGSYNELSVAAIIWDLYDDDGGAEAHDSVAGGLAPIWQAMRQEVAETEAFTTILPFLGAFGASGDSIAAHENVIRASDYEDSALGDIGPRYTPLTVGAGPVSTDASGRAGILTYEIDAFAPSDVGVHLTQKFYDWQYFRATPDGSGFYTIDLDVSSGDAVLSQGSGIYASTDDGGSIVDDSVMIEHADAEGEIIFRVGSNPDPTLPTRTTTFSVEITGAPAG